MIYRLLRGLVWLALRVFYRRIEVEGLQNVPATGPVLFVPNHVNALVDPLLIVDQLRRPVTLTAKNVLANNRLLGWVMKQAGVVSFHRAEDVGKGADRRQNVRSLQLCREILSAGGAVCIFPEGISHSDVSLRPFRPGPARLALDFARRHDAVERLSIIPVGILYTAKQQFRSDVWLRFGTPIDPTDWLHDRSAEALTTEIHRRVADLTLDFETRRESALLQWTSEIVMTGGRATPQVGEDVYAVSRRFELMARLRSDYRELVDRQPEVIDDLSRRIRVYRSELRRRGIAPEEVYLPMDWRRAMLFVVREMELLVVGTPLALFGAINHSVPALLVRWVARATSREVDHWASNVIYPGAVIFPLYYALVISAAWLTLTPLWAALYTVALPYTGYYLLLMWDRSWAVFRRTRTFITFQFRPQVQARLADEGHAIIESLHGLDGSLQAEHRRRLDESCDQTSPVHVDRSAWKMQLTEDRDAVHSLLASLQRLKEEWTQARNDIAARSRGYFTPDEDDRVRSLLLTYRNHRLALYEIIRHYVDYERIEPIEDRLRGFLIGQAAAVSLYARTLELTAAYESDPLIRKKLNESDARFGVRAGFFDELVSAHRSLSNYRAILKAHRYWVLHRRTLRRLGVDQDAPWDDLCAVISQQHKVIRRSLARTAVARLQLGALHLGERASRSVHGSRYRVRSYLGTMFADLRTTWSYQPALNESVFGELSRRLETGDILLMRSEPKVTSALLPGFWAHTALYVRNISAIEKLGLQNESRVKKQIASLTQQDVRFGFVLEAIHAGVILRPLGRCLQADHVVCLRLQLDADGRRAALQEAFAQFGKAYDFEFDFNDSSRLVCTELIYRSFHRKGPIAWSLTKRLGRYTLTADDLIGQLFDIENGPPLVDVVALVLCDATGQAHFINEGQVPQTLQKSRTGYRPAREMFQLPDEVSP